MPVVYLNARIFTGEQFITGHAVITDNGHITGVVPVAEIKADDNVVDLQGAMLAPALIDLQIYGGNGLLYSAHPSVEALSATNDYCRAGGAAHFMITIPTISREIMEAAIVMVRTYWQQGGKGLLGLHLEGPFLNEEKKGAHASKYIKVPTQQDIDWIIQNNDVVKIITMAPENCTPAQIKALRTAGVVVSGGHSNATYEQATAGFNAGIDAATHLFNAMSPLQSRAPGIVGAIYDHDRVCSSVVVDGIHVDFAAVRISKKIMGQRLFLITDAVTSSTTGDYQHTLKNGHYATTAGILSGSSLTMLKAVHNCVEKVGIPLEEALRMGALYPARVIGREDVMGRIAPGYQADMVVFDDQYQVLHCI
ncbi:N-acetylglucosamine-6-phosphate deacetylase [Chitinophaga defluvii]|uniref:N-acetylglucosamine-6-phosphate deacetylase n=1 Tax=Chitinophaga defluvii TaxID=3163343 RepID=A0ABV2T8F9_9BACT